MADESDDIADRHRRICQTFGGEVGVVGEHWHSQSPCSEWDARGVLEHVIGFHDVLLLRPLGVKPQRPKDDPVGRWRATIEALDLVLSRPGLFDGVIDVPPVGNHPPSKIDAARLAPMLSLEVLIHTWDLARSAGHDITLDPELCRTSWPVCHLMKEPSPKLACKAGRKTYPLDHMSRRNFLLAWVVIPVGARSRLPPTQRTEAPC
jgi:uncharacterized protein (TIGR03083 family)